MPLTDKRQLISAVDELFTQRGVWALTDAADICLAMIVNTIGVQLTDIFSA
jgi:hypothetical protein